MFRMSPGSLEKLNAFIASLPEEARSKCALCNETLTHIVKQAEAQTGAGTATVARVLADKINDGAAPGDRVSEDALRMRVDYHERGKCRKSSDKPAPETKPEPKQQKPAQTTWAIDFAGIAISQLERIQKGDPMRIEALNRVKAWIEKQLAE